MSESNYVPSGELQGDTKAMPDRGTRTGMGDNVQDGGMSLDPTATNRMGSITSATKSDPAAECSSDDPAFGPAKGDDDRGEMSA